VPDLTVVPDREIWDSSMLLSTVGPGRAKVITVMP